MTEAELDVVSYLHRAMQPPKNVERMRAVLASAKQDGLDVAFLYDAAARTVNKRWGPMPPYDEVAPG